MIAGARQGVVEAGPSRTHALANLLLLASFVASVLASPGVFVKLGALILVFLLAILSGGSLGPFLARSRFVLCFSLFLFVVQAFFVRDGRAIVSLGLVVTDRGLLFGAQTALRFLVIVSSSLLFVLVTDPDRLARAIMGLGAPYRYVYVFVLALRFVPFFREEYRTVREAQRVRGLDRPIRTLHDLRRSVRHTFLPVLAAGLVRVDAIAISMKGRAFGLHSKRTVTRRERWLPANLVPVGSSALLLGATILARRWGWP